MCHRLRTPGRESQSAAEGEVEVLVHSGERFHWLPVRSGDVIHVPCGAKHAWRNRSGEPAVSVVLTEESLAAFFREVGLPGSFSP